MTVAVGTTIHMDICVTRPPTYDDDQYIGVCLINGVPHHITLFPVVGGDGEQDAAPGHHDRFDALQDFEADVVSFMPLTVGDKAYLCVITPQSI